MSCFLESGNQVAQGSLLRNAAQRGACGSHDSSSWYPNYPRRLDHAVWTREEPLSWLLRTDGQASFCRSVTQLGPLLNSEPCWASHVTYRFMPGSPPCSTWLLIWVTHVTATWAEMGYKAWVGSCMFLENGMTTSVPTFLKTPLHRFSTLVPAPYVTTALLHYNHLIDNLYFTSQTSSCTAFIGSDKPHISIAWNLSKN